MAGKNRTIQKSDPSLNFSGNWSGLAGGNEIQEESSWLFDWGLGYFGFEGYHLASESGSSAVLLTDGTNFFYDDYLDENGSYDLYDDNASGAFNTGKSFRVIENAKNVTDITGLNLKIRAKDLTLHQGPPADECWIDPINGKFALPSPQYWSRTDVDSDNTWVEAEIVESLKSPEIINTGSFSSKGKLNIKFNEGWHRYSLGYSNSYNVPGSNSGTSNIYPYGQNSKNWNKGVTSLWIKNSAIASSSTFGTSTAQTYHYINHETDGVRVQIYQNHSRVDTSDSSVTRTMKIFFGPTEKASIDFSSYNNVVSHLYIVWDADKSLSGGKSVIVYINGSEVMSSTDSIPSMSAHKLYHSLYTYGYGNLTTIFGGYHRGDSTIGICNLKIWDYVVEETPGWIYNSGTGRQDAIHPIYGIGQGYEPTGVKVGYYYVGESTIPASITEPDGSDNDEVQLENPTNENYGYGEFGTGMGQWISGTNPSMVVERFERDVDFYYNEELDGTGTHAIDIYDPSNSGVLDTGSGRYFRIVNDGINVSNVSGLNLTPMAKNLANISVSPPKDEVWIDPLRSIFVLPKPRYWSKCESVENLIGNPTIGNNLTSIDHSSYLSINTVTYKFNNSLQFTTPANSNNKLRFLGNDFAPNQGTISMWFQLDPNDYPKFYISFKEDFTTYIALTSSNGVDSHYLFVNNINVATSTIDLNTLKHLYIVWDTEAGLTGSKTIRLFINGVERLSSTTTWNNSTALYFNFVESNNIAPINFILDNIKVWDHVVSEDPSWEYNSGTGNENGLHEIYGLTNNYTTKLTSGDSGGVGYFLLDYLMNTLKWTI